MEAAPVLISVELLNEMEETWPSICANGRTRMGCISRHVADAFFAF
jgi:hypothetical protein